MVRIDHVHSCCGLAVVWQSRVCSCWVCKCLLCGNVGYADCGAETETHWDDFESACQEMS